jgi:NAD(P)-dependent dehydrogenase (short-subunit alcohol dehydrogenase family)
MTEGRLAGRSAVVTGAGGDIGRAIAVRLAREGATVIATARRESTVTDTLDEVARAGGIAHPFVVDITDPDGPAGILPAAEREFGSVPDILVCCAGAQTFADIFELPIAEWDHVFDVNARGTFLTIRPVADAMRRAQRGSIVTVASIQGRVGNPWFAHYAASKAAVLSLTKSFAVALAPHRVRVNAVAPGIIDAGLARKANEELARIQGLPPGEPMRRRVAQVPLGRAGKPDDVANAVLFLASDEADYITGECLHVCGGDVML